jgi:alpha-mannosidase
VDVPEVEADECMFLKVTTGKEGQWDAQNPQGMIFIGDSTTCAQALDTNHTEFMLTPGKKEIYIYFYSGMFDNAVLFIGAALQKKNMTINRLYYDILVPYQAMMCLDKNSYEYNTIINHLDKA